jgi:endoglucanase
MQRPATITSSARAEILARAALSLGLLLSVAPAACGARVIGEAQPPLHPIPAPGMSGTVVFDPHILVDQFGYRPDDTKVAVVRDPHVGYDSARRFTPGSSYQLRRAADGEVVFTSAPEPWNQGQVEASSGDAGWWLDFSAFKTPGIYFLYDTTRKVRSATFAIRADVYAPILKAALRMYYYQRSGFAKKAPFAPQCWSDDAAYVGAAQDTQAHDITDRDNRAKVRDLSGGWFDAGDTNKYVTFASLAVHRLLTAYQETPSAFGDDVGIPESGNGVPDVLDEVKWEIAWLRKMQNTDGSAALKVGEIVDATGVQPSLDRNPRYYIPTCTSATIAVAGMFAHAAVVFGSVGPLHGESADLQARAQRAWANYQRTPKQIHCDSGVIRAGNADWSEANQASEAVVAAVYLYALTGSDEFGAYVRTHYRETRPYRDFGWSRYDPEQGEALLFYTTLANADPATRAAILADKARDAGAANHVYGFQPLDDLYRAFLHDESYSWGSNAPRADYGSSNLDVINYRVAATGAASDYRLRALEILHYFHGVNPFGMAYLSNMYGYGATRSVNEIYHTLFWHGSKWSDALYSECGPAPGFVPGGPSASAVKDGVPASLVPPAGQPPQKSYRDWNTPWPESSWTLTEPGIYYQAAYVELLSQFVGTGAAGPVAATPNPSASPTVAAGDPPVDASAAMAVGDFPAAAANTSTAKPKPQAKPSWVYHEGEFLWAGDYSFNARPAYNDKEGAAADGRRDIKVTLTGPWGGFQPYANHMDFDLSHYAYLTFALKPTTDRQSLAVYFEKAGDTPAGVGVDPLRYGPPPVVGEWTTYKIPLADLGVAGQHVFKFAIQDKTGLANNVFYLNDIGFLPADP